MKIAVGICTYNRPDMLEKSAKAAARHLSGVVGRWYVYNDGSDPKHTGAYKRAYKPLEALGARVTDCPDNRGVAAAKNELLRQMIGDGAEWLFLLEDDIKILDPRAVTGYIQACQYSGLEHLMFAHHGPGNTGGPVDADGPVSFYEHAIGAWCVYSARAISKVGLFDENLVNAWEHVEHSLRLAAAGLTTGPYRWADATGSQDWLTEVHGSIDRSSIRPRPDWQANIVGGLTYWREAKPDTFDLMFGDGTPLEGWAKRMLGVAA